MLFNEQQFRLWYSMIINIEDYRKGKIQYSTLVYELEGALDAGEFKNQNLVEQWYDYWIPLEIVFASKGDRVTIDDVDKYLLDMETFLRSIPHKFDSFTVQDEE